MALIEFSHQMNNPLPRPFLCKLHHKALLSDKTRRICSLSAMLAARFPGNISFCTFENFHTPIFGPLCFDLTKPLHELSDIVKKNPSNYSVGEWHDYKWAFNFGRFQPPLLTFFIVQCILKDHFPKILCPIVTIPWEIKVPRAV